MSNNLWRSLLMASVVLCLVALPAEAEEISNGAKGEQERSHAPLVKKSWGDRHLLAQSPIQVTGVKLNPTETGIEVILETSQGKALQPRAIALGKSYIANIPNAVLVPQKQEFRQDNPASRITRVSVTQTAANSIRVTVTGATGVPAIELFDSPTEGLIFGVASAATSTPQGQQAQPPQEGAKPGGETDKPTAEGEETEIVVTGEQEETGHNVPDASTATKTDTPLRDIPQSIQVVPRQVLEDRKPRNLTEAVETVSGVLEGGDYYGTPAGPRVIRGFQQEGNYRNGYRDTDYYSLTGIGTIEQVEVLKGPASVLFGAVEPGGIVNIITRQPLSEPYYNLEFEAGNRNFYQPSLDFSEPLNTDETLLYRFITSYQSSDSFQDFVTTDLTTIAPSITWKLGDRTTLNLYYEYINFDGNPQERDLPAFSDNTFRLPRSRYLGYPEFDFVDITTQKTGYTLSHNFSDDWQIRNSLSITFNTVKENYTRYLSLVEDRFIEAESNAREYLIDNYFGQIDLLGKFETGAISHQILLGFDINRNVEHFQRSIGDIPNLDVFNPDYNVATPEYVPISSFYEPIQSYGIYLQDQIGLLDNLKLLIGGRVDWVERIYDVAGKPTQEQNDSAFSPRVGLVYQPSDSVALYTSYSQSFIPTFGFNPDNRAFQPTKGKQYEAGIKAGFLEGRLSTTLAAYHITKENVTTADPDNPGFSIQVGEQRSQGIELDIAGEILPGWKVIASYAYTDAETTEDTSITVGNRLRNVPENQASLWTTYEIQSGDLEGLGFDLGLFYVGARQGDLNNSFELGDYLRTDAAIYYRRGRFNAALNIRNLFDTFYYTDSFSRLLVAPGAPFTITGSISWEF